MVISESYVLCFLNSLSTCRTIKVYDTVLV